MVNTIKVAVERIPDAIIIGSETDSLMKQALSLDDYRANQAITHYVGTLLESTDDEGIVLEWAT